MVHFLAHERDAGGLSQLLLDVTSSGHRVSSWDRNRALSICISNDALDLAEILAGPEACALLNAKMDVVGLNTIMKAYATAGSTSSCLAVLEKMRAARLSPSNTTFGILLDCCVKAKEYDLAEYVFGQIQHCGLKPNVVHYTTLMKGFADAHRLPEATALLEEMRSSPSLRPDFMTFSTIIKAYADHGSTERALEILKEMIASGIPPDGFIFHSVLGGCSVRRMKGDEVVDVLHELISLGLKPSNATLGCLIRALVL